MATERIQRVLYVEDDLDAAQTLAEYLRSANLEPSLVRSAEKALFLLETAQGSLAIDLLITDLSLPGIDGAELCRILRADPAHCHLPILLLTGVRQRLGIEITPGDKTWAPADRILDKSETPQQILAVVKELLDTKPPC